jgi:hypothetical protein
MIGGVVPPFSCRKPLCPFLRFLKCHASQVLLQTLIHTFSLAIRLRVVSCAEIEFHLQSREYFLPNLGSENPISVTDDYLRRAM